MITHFPTTGPTFGNQPRRTASVFGAHLRSLRDQRNLSQSGLARLSGIDASTVSKVESGADYPTYDTVRTIADSLGLHGDERQATFASAGYIERDPTPVPVPVITPTPIRAENVRVTCPDCGCRFHAQAAIDRAKRLRDARLAAGISIRQLAKIVGWTAAYISDIERAKSPIPTNADKMSRWHEAIGFDDGADTTTIHAPEHDASSFPDTLRTYRERRMVSQARLAIRAGLDRSYMNRLEQGERQPKRNEVHAIVTALELAPNDAAKVFMSAGFLPYDADQVTALVHLVQSRGMDA